MNPVGIGNFQPIAFPALIRLQDKLIPTGLEFLTVYWKARREKDEIISINEPLNADILWVIDANGLLFSFQRAGTYRKTPKSIKWLINFERIRYSISPAKHISFDQLRGLVSGAKGRFPKEIRKICNIHGLAGVLTGEIFLREIMRSEANTAFEFF